jgi:glycosyltransferase involved in cell wall biosynthesis
MKKRVLIFIDWYLPGYKAGGPIKSISSIVNYLKNDFEFFIFTTNSDFGDKNPYNTVISNQWIKTEESVSVFYASPDFLKTKNIYQLIKSLHVDLVYLNGVFSFNFSILPLIFFRINLFKVPVLIAPRGMLGQGALQLKAYKKTIFINLAKSLGLYQRVYWQATAQQEKLEIEKIMGHHIKLSVVGNLQYNQLSTSVESVFKKSGTLKLFFLSRITEKKNLLFALDILSGMAKTDHLIEYDIIGPIEDEVYWAKCLQKIKLLPNNIKVTYVGHVKNTEINSVISRYHFLFLPTLNENYGHSIVESLLNGKPVIISNATPWRELNDHQVGWDLDLNKKSEFIELINTCLNMNNDTYQLMCNNSILYAKKYCIANEEVEKTKTMFISVMKNE